MRIPVDFVIITALREEWVALLAKVPSKQRLPPTAEDIRIYYWSEVEATFSDGSTHQYSVILLSLLGMGRVEAANATHDAINRWHPRYVIVMGVAGGLAANKVKLGDVVIADQIVDYELQKIPEDGPPEVRYSVHRADPRLLGAAQHLEAEDWMKLIVTKRPRVGIPQTIFGPIATGDKVVAFALVMERYRHAWPKLIGVEMEAGGATSAIFQRDNPPGFFMVRGVSDLADENKNNPQVKMWRGYAAEIAASFLIALLRSGPIPPISNTNKIEWATSLSPMGEKFPEKSWAVTETTEGTTEVDATIIHVEDWKEWREEVRDTIERIGRINFRTFISRSSLAEIEDELRSIRGPIVLLMDLRLEAQDDKYSGYRWLLQDFKAFKDRNPGNTVFVISGNLHEAITETLLYQGIEQSHIYDKGTWAIKQHEFLSTLRRVLRG